MSIFTESSFEQLMGRLIAIHPLRRESITGVGYDLTIGFYIKVNPRTRKVLDARQTTTGGGMPGITMETGTYLIVISREFVCLSSRVAATFHSKSQLAAQAIFLNSTSGDPNWSGRLIFLLYNASGGDVELETDGTFTTMVVQSVERRSRMVPKESKVVLTRYLKGLTPLTTDAIDYVWRDGPEQSEFKRQAEGVRRFADRPSIVVWSMIRIHLCVVWTARHGPGVIRFALVVVLLSMSALFLWVAFRQPAELLTIMSGGLVTALGSVASILSGIAGVIMWSRRRKPRE